jgi:hypothetical protein
VLALTSTAAMKSRRLVTSRKLADGHQRAVCLSVGSLAASRTRSPPAKTPAQAAPIQSQVHNMSALQIAAEFVRLNVGSGGTDVYLRGDGCAERPALQRRCGARGAYVASSIVDERLSALRFPFRKTMMLTLSATSEC